jgi:hypothetical protein
VRASGVLAALFASADFVAPFFDFDAAGLAGDDAASSSSTTPIASRPALVIQSKATVIILMPDRCIGFGADLADESFVDER